MEVLNQSRRGFQNIQPYADAQRADARAGGGGRSWAMLEPRLVVRHKGRGGERSVFYGRQDKPEKGRERHEEKVSRCDERRGENEGNALAMVWFSLSAQPLYILTLLCF